MTCGSPSGLFLSWSPQVIQALHTDPAAYLHIVTYGFVTALSLAPAENLSAQARPPGSVLLPSVGINLAHEPVSYSPFCRTDISHTIPTYLYLLSIDIYENFTGAIRLSV